MLFQFTADLIEHFKLNEIISWRALEIAARMDSMDLHSLIDECSDFGQEEIDGDRLEAILYEIELESE